MVIAGRSMDFQMAGHCAYAPFTIKEEYIISYNRQISIGISCFAKYIIRFATINKVSPDHRKVMWDKAEFIP